MSSDAESEQRDEELDAKVDIFGFGSAERSPKRQRLFAPRADDEQPSFFANKKQFKDWVCGSDSDGDFRGSSGSDSSFAERKHAARAQRPRPPKRKRPSTSPVRGRPAAAPVEESLADELKESGLAPEDPAVPIPGVVAAAKPAKRSPRLADWESIEEDEPEINPISTDWCALCKVTKRTVEIDADNAFLADMTTYAEENWAHASQEEMGTELQVKWNTTLRPYVEPEAMRLPCHKQQFWRHFAYHERTTRIDMEMTSLGMQIMLDDLLEEQVTEKALTSNVKKGNFFLKLAKDKGALDAKLSQLRPNKVL